jgi:O-antigen/teichoic acid export membrane protein
MLTRLRSQFRLSTVSSLQLFQLIRYSGNILIGICFARMGIAKTEIGKFETFLWWMGLFSFFWIAGLMNSMLAHYSQQSDTDKKKLLFTTFCLILILSVAAGLVQLFVGGSILGLIYLLLNNASYVVEYIFFLQDHRRRLIIYGAVMAIVQLLLCVVPAYIYRDTHYALYGLTVAAAIRFLYIVYLLGRHTLTEFQFTRVRQLFLLSLPLMLSFLVNGSAEFIDGAVMKHYFTLADFSVFRYGARDFPLFTIMAATLSMSLIPRVAENLSDGLDSIKKESLRYMHLFFPLAIVLILCSKWLFIFVFTASFAESGRIFAALLLLTITRMLFPQTILTALKANTHILSAAIAEMLLNIVCSILLAQRFGMVGVAYGTVIAFLFEKMWMTAVLYYKYDIAPARYTPLLPFASYSILMVLAYIASLAF